VAEVPDPISLQLLSSWFNTAWTSLTASRLLRPALSWIGKPQTLHFAPVERSRHVGIRKEPLRLNVRPQVATSPRLADLMADLALIHLWSSNYEAAETTARQALAIAEQAPASSPYRIKPHLFLGDLLVDTERYDEAEQHIQRGLHLAQTLYGDHMPDAFSSLAELRMRQGRLAEAESAIRAAIHATVLMEGTETPTMAHVRAALGMILLKDDRVDAAISESRASLTMLAKTARPNHPYVASAKHILADALCRKGNFKEAEGLLLDEIRLWKDSNAPQWRVARAVSSLGEAVLGQGRVDEAAKHLTFASEQLDGVRGAQQADARRATQERLEKLQRMQQLAQRRTLDLRQPQHKAAR
jgi:tetratricopeptide (TPR) repeat protein